ncbi:MAG: hypothetical protein IKR86_11240 [Candidatus Methanomethylophilaceae archaeon]|nr:hypothetical protein [Candidatus Methanomethylophilaceae archaeon]
MAETILSALLPAMSRTSSIVNVPLISVSPSARMAILVSRSEQCSYL